MALWKWFRRWRATRGYGVHSPLAFRIVSHVLRPERGVAYYGEERLSTLPGAKSGADIRRARLLLRFVAEFQPSFVWVSPGLPQIYREAVRLAGCVVRIFDGDVFPEEAADADMAVGWGASLKKKELRKVLVPGKYFIGFNLSPRVVRDVESLVSGGVLIEGGADVIAVPSQHSQLHSYEVLPF